MYQKQHEEEFSEKICMVKKIKRFQLSKNIKHESSAKFDLLLWNRFHK